jgi:hypothetical protein
MTNQAETHENGMSENAGDALPKPPKRELLPLPGLAAISLYLLVLAGVIILGVVGGGHYPFLFLIFAAAFMTASAGLLLLLRWAWAMALGAGVASAGPGAAEPGLLPLPGPDRSAGEAKVGKIPGRSRRATVLAGIF